MARIKLDIPANCIATIEVPVRITDINYGNHVGNDAFAGILHEARMQWLRRRHFTELDIEGIGLIMSDLVIVFKEEGLYGDRMEVQLHCGEYSRVAFELYYSIYTVRNEERILIATAKTGMVCYDYAAKKAMPIPTVLLQLLQLS